MECPQCGQHVGAPEWKARKTGLWHNQYGYKVRVFCDACGAMNDVTVLFDKLVKVETRIESYATRSQPP